MTEDDEGDFLGTGRVGGLEGSSLPFKHTNLGFKLVVQSVVKGDGTALT